MTGTNTRVVVDTHACGAQTHTHAGFLPAALELFDCVSKQTQKLFFFVSFWKGNIIEAQWREDSSCTEPDTNLAVCFFAAPLSFNNVLINKEGSDKETQQDRKTGS